MDQVNTIKTLLEKNQEIRESLSSTKLEVTKVKREIHVILDIILEMKQDLGQEPKIISLINNSDLALYFKTSY